MKTYFTNSRNMLSRWARFLGAMLIAILMVPVTAFSNATVPNLNLPANGAHPCVSTTPTLSWNAATGSGSITYELQVSLVTDFGSTVYDVSGLTGLSQMVPATGFLKNATVYYWRVQATDGVGPSGYSSYRTFTTSPTAVNLGSTSHFAILAQSGISTTGATSIPAGDIGVSPAAATYITGFGLTLDASGTFSTSSLVTDKIYAADYGTPTPSNLTAAIGDLGTAYSDAGSRPTDYTELYSGNLTGQTLTAGVYYWSSGVSVDNSGGVTLSGSATDVWIFQIAQTLTVGDNVIITLSGGALASNVFWQAAQTVSLGSTDQMKGNILCHTNISMNTGTSLSGRALAQTAVTLIANAITRPPLYAAYANPATVNLSRASHFRILAGTTITIGSGSTNPGDIGLSPGHYSDITNNGIVTGTIYTIDGTNHDNWVVDATGVGNAKSDLATAYGVARDKTVNATEGPELGNITLGCGVYKSTSGSFDITGTLTLSGSATDIFIFQTTAGSGTLTTAANSKVVLINGALASNVFWQIGASASLGASSVFKGTIMAEQSISVDNNASLDGKMLASAGAVNLGTGTVALSVYTNPATIDLGTAANFRILAGNGITITSTAVTGNVGEYPGTAITNTGGSISGTQNMGDVTAHTAQNDLGTAYGTASGRTANAMVASELGGTTLGCGVYYSADGTFGITSTLTLNGTASDVFIFKMTSSLTSGASSHVTLTGGAVWSNVFWQVGSSATIDGDFKGNILALTAISQTAGTVAGRLLAQNAAVVVGGSTVLPVELVSFTATTNRLNAELRWSTATEVNNYGFDVERRLINSQSSTLNTWVKIGFVKGSGTSNSAHSYSYTDASVSSGTYAYRLKQIDNNGTYKYSSAAEVTVSAPKVFALNQNYPNPFNPTTTITFTLAQDGFTTLKIYDVLGREVTTLVNGEMKAGVANTVSFNATKLSSGVYLYRLESGSLVSTKKLLLMK